MTRDKILNNLAESSLYGNLGIFAGAGVSMAIMNDGCSNIALDWGKLLEQISLKFGIDYVKDICSIGLSYPEIATKLCKRIAIKEKIGYNNAVDKLKEKISELTSWYPDKSKRDEFYNLFNDLNLSWIITTNYDSILESILTGRAISLGPDDQLSAPKGFIPIYHLHGIRTNPSSIIITQEDYITLFRPNDYRHIKLPLTIKESTTLILGYGLGDINVLTALDWSKNVYKNVKRNHPNFLVQVLKKEEPSPSPYSDDNGIIIIETHDISDFLKELQDVIVKKTELETIQQNNIKAFEQSLKNPNKDDVERFIDDQNFRIDVIHLLADYKNYLITGFLEYLSKVIDVLWDRSSSDGAFYAYNQNLIVLLDILINSNINNMPPALLEMVVYNLNQLGSYIGNNFGQSFEASNTWESLKMKIPKDTVKEIRYIANSHSFYKVKDLFKGL
jgi:hypothetical protein